MQKKILASLLVAPLAFNSFAAIDLDNLNDPNNWEASGLVGDQLIINQDNNSITAAVGSGVLKQTLSLKPGDYKITFASLNNAKVTLKGADLKAVAGEQNSYSFKLDVAADVTIEITAKDASTSFSFEGAQLILDFDFEAAATVLTDALNEIKWEALTEGNDTEEAKTLGELKANLDKEEAGIRADIEAIGQGSLDIYENYKFYENPNALQTRIEAFAKKVSEYNEGVKAANEKFQKITDNKAAEALLNEGVARLREKLVAVNAEIDRTIEATTNADIKAALEEVKQNGTVELTKAINKYEADIKGAYADPSKDITFESKEDEISTAIDSYQAKFNMANADQNAYYDFKVQREAFDKLYEQAMTTLSGLAGVEGQENVFNGKINEWQDQIKKTYDNAIEALKFKEGVIDGYSASDYADDTKAVSNATGEINVLVEDATTLVKTQNDLMIQASESLAEIQGLIDDLDKITIQEVVDKVSAIKTEFDGLKTEVEGKYKEQTLTGDFSTTAEDLKTRLNDITEQVQPILDAQKSLEEAIEYVNNAIKDTPELKGKFNGTIESIQQGINDLTLADNDNTEVMSAIQQMKDNADKLVEVFSKAKAAVNGFETSITELNEIISNKVIVEGSTFSKEDYQKADPYKSLEAKHQKFVNDLAAAGAAEAQTCYDKAVALSQAIEEYEYANKIEEVTLDFETKATEANKKVADDLLAAVKIYAQEGEYAGKESVDFTTVEGDLATIAGEITAAETTSPVDSKLFNTCDTKIEKAIEDIKVIQAKVAKLKADQEAYDSFVASTDEIQTLVEEAAAFNEKTSLSPAKEYFDGVISYNATTPAEGSLQADLNAIVKDLEEALKKTEVVSSKADFESRIEALKTKVDNTEKRIKANEDAHNEQLADSKFDRDYILKLIEAIKAKDNEGSEFVQNWLKTLDDLLTNDLTTLDRDVTNSYAVGESGEMKETYKKRYKDILSSAEAVNKEFNDNYGDNVSYLNNQLTATSSEWAAKIESLRAVYNKSVNEYNIYKYDLKNAGYRKYLKQNGLSDHENIYQYSAKINKLRTAVEVYVKKQNGLHHVITAAEFKIEAFDQAQKLVDEMDSYVTQLTKFVNDNAEAYYNQEYGNESGNIDYAETILTDAGVAQELIDNFINPFKEQLSDIADAKVKAEGNTEVPFGQSMDAIADLLDQIQKVLDMQSVAQAQWNSNYNKAKSDVAEKIKELNEKIPADTTKLSKATQSVLCENQAVIEAAENGIETINTEATLIDPLIYSLKEKTEKLDVCVKTVSDAVSAIEEVLDAEEKNAALIEVFETEISDLEKSYEEFVKFVNGLAVSTHGNTSGLKAEIDNVKGYFNNNKNVLSVKAYSEEMERMISEAGHSLTSAFETVRFNEIIVLSDYLLKTKVAFNNVKANKLLDDETLNGYNGRIDAASNELDKLKDPSMTNADFLAEAENLEKEIAGIYQALQQKWAEINKDEVNPLETALANLQAQYDEVNAAIVAGKSYLDECLDDVQNSDAKYGEQYETLLTRLNGLKSEWESKGDVAIMSQERYIDMMKSLLNEVNSLSAQVQKAEQSAQAEKLRKETSDNRAADLQTEIDGLRTSYENLVDTINGYDENLSNHGEVSTVMPSCEYRLRYISAWLAADQEWLNAQKEGYLLVADSQLPHKASIERWTDETSVNASARYAVISRMNSEHGIFGVNSILANHEIDIIKNVREEVSDALDNLRIEYQTAFNELIGIVETVDNHEEIIKQRETLAGTFLRIGADAEALADKLVDAEYTPGDVNLDPNHEVTVADVQLVITWVGEGVTLDELSPRQAAAADVNGDDVLNIADITGIIRLTMDADNGMTGAPYAVSRRIASDQGFISVEAMERENGVRRYAVLLDNSTTFIGGQLDIMLPAGCSVEDITLGDRVQNHSIAIFDNVAGRTRVVITSMENAAFDGNQGTLLFVDVRGAGTPTVENALFSDQNCNAVEVKQRGTTAIESIQDGLRNTKDAIYDAAGRAMRSVQRGINIIRHSDGTVTKELKK